MFFPVWFRFHGFSLHVCFAYMGQLHPVHFCLLRAFLAFSSTFFSFTWQVISGKHIDVRMHLLVYFMYMSEHLYNF